jgi:hypothetical protein
MTIVSGTFTAGTQTSNNLALVAGEYAVITLSGTWTGEVIAEHRDGPNQSWCQCETFTSNGTRYRKTVYPSTQYRLLAATVSSGSINYRLETCDAQTSFNPEWDDDKFPASIINVTGSTAPPGVDTNENAFPGTLLFDAAGVEMASVIEQMPHGWVEGSAIRPHIHAAKTTSAAGNIIWHLYYRHINRGASPGAWTGPLVGVPRINDANLADAEIIWDFGDIDMSGKVASVNIAYSLYRMGDDVADTYAADARLFEFDVHYQKGTHGSAGEYVKPV